MESLDGDLYQGERKDILLDVLSATLNNIPKDSRRYDIISGIVNRNSQMGQKDSLVGEIKQLLSQYREMDSAIKSSLERMGFRILSDGKHHKLIFRNDDRYIVILPKTSSDHRAGRNIVSKIKKLLF